MICNVVDDIKAGAVLEGVSLSNDIITLTVQTLYQHSHGLFGHCLLFLLFGVFTDGVRLALFALQNCEH